MSSGKNKNHPQNQGKENSSTPNQAEEQKPQQENAWTKRLAKHSDSMNHYFNIMEKEENPITQDMAFKAMLMEYIRFFECSQNRQHKGCAPVVVEIAKTTRNLIAHPEEDYERRAIAALLTLLAKNMGQPK